MLKIALRSLLSIAGVALVTFLGQRVFQVNATTAGFAYLLLVLIVASTWGFTVACLASVAATLLLNLWQQNCVTGGYSKRRGTAS